MKSRIINTKHLRIDGINIYGLTSELKPSLFYYDKPDVARHDLYVQFMDKANKMVKFTFVKELSGDDVFARVDSFEPTRKFREKYKWCKDLILYIQYDKANLFGDSNRPVHRKRDYYFKNKKRK